MKHYRRRRLVKALTDMYLNNWKASDTYADQARTIRCLESVGAVARKQFETDCQGDKVTVQLPLFS